MTKNESYFSKAVSKEAKTELIGDAQSNWAPTELRPVPAFYMLEQSSQFVEDDLSEVVTRISEVRTER